LLDIFTNCVDDIDFTLDSRVVIQLTLVGLLTRFKVLLIVIDVEEVVYLYFLLAIPTLIC